MSAEITRLESQIFELTKQLAELRVQNPGSEVRNYTFDTLNGSISLLELFGGQDTLLVIHNMGQGCRYCTLWGDGLNGFVPHIESSMALVLVSKDEPKIQRRFANSRGWQFQLASHGGGDYIREQTVMDGMDNMPGAVVYERRGEKILRKNACVFGPGDLYCSIWPLLGMAGMTTADWTPQFKYWSRPGVLDDGGENLVD